MDSILDWQIIATAEDAKAFADKLAARPINTQRRTSISAAIAYGSTSLVSNAYRGMRQVIDISGDGPNNVGAPVVEVRDKAVSAGVIINGLPLLIRPSVESDKLDQYYADCVIGGPARSSYPFTRSRISLAPCAASSSSRSAASSRPPLFAASRKVQRRIA